ncbi:hypothetical protein [Anatilimnocola floriformis]|uniref:hypothetical protein n=1 Tax=Anatilimnocola floriformis TaxID=2948575 RepID=UPI0020C1D7FF|nr:hypothetical protein [Anatilimnocola floriformis]
MTCIDYPDLIRRSPSSNLRLEIRSPDNDRESPRSPTTSSREFWGGFQSDFTYTVTRSDSGEVVWSRTPDEHDLLGMPNDAWVSDDGHVVVIVRTPFSSYLLVVDPRGQTIGQYDVASEVLESNDDEFRDTSAGSHWNRRGRGHCFVAAGKPYWSFRTLLDRQILVDLEQGKIVAGGTAACRERRRVQRRWALATLRKNVNDQLLQRPPRSQPDWRILNRLWIAIFWCGLDRTRSALPALRQAERATISGGYTSGWKHNGKSTDLVIMLLVRVTQFALRRLGEEPAGYAPYWLCRNGAAPQRTRIPLPELLTDRAARLDQLQIGMNHQQVVNLVGMPDVDGFGWYYDVLAGPYSLKLTWDHQSDTVEKIELEPPGWIEWKSRASWL